MYAVVSNGSNNKTNIGLLRVNIGLLISAITAQYLHAGKVVLDSQAHSLPIFQIANIMQYLQLKKQHIAMYIIICTTYITICATIMLVSYCAENL